MLSKENRRRAVMFIQQTLRAVYETDKTVPLINPDGIYGEDTAQAVRVFQSVYGFEQTGVVDLETWKGLCDEKKRIDGIMAGGIPIQPFPSSDYVARKGEESTFVHIVQIMLSELDVVYDNLGGLETDGVYGDVTEAHVTRFQGHHNIDQTGEVNLETWNMLATSFNSFFNNERYTS